jgi:hypothetical protein
MVHVGDIIGEDICERSVFVAIRDKFNSLHMPVMLTPGDNDWIDCSQWENPLNESTRREPHAALDTLRQVFYREMTVPGVPGPKGTSMGAQRKVLKRQSDKTFNAELPGYDHRVFVENQRWTHGNVVFVTYHSVGSYDGCTVIHTNLTTTGSTSNIPTSCDAEYQARSLANADWLKQAFDEAIATNASGLVIFTHVANQYSTALIDAFTGACLGATPGADCLLSQPQRQSIISGFRRFNKPVLVFNGDGHRFATARPLGNAVQFTTIECIGAPDTGFLRIAVDPNSPTVFSTPTKGYCDKFSLAGPDAVSFNCDSLTQFTNVLASSDVVLPFGDVCTINNRPRRCESLEANVINDAVRNRTDSDFAMYNAGGIRAALTCDPAATSRIVCPVFVGGVAPPYNITDGSVVETIPFFNKVLKFRISGSELKLWLENSVRDMPAQGNRFGQWSGLCFHMHISNPVGSRIQRAFVADSDGSCSSLSPEIDLSSSDLTYTLAANSFVIAGGDGYPSNTLREFIEFNELDVNYDSPLVWQYLTAVTQVQPRPQCRIVCTSSNPAVPCPTVLPTYATAYNAACTQWFVV